MNMRFKPRMANGLHQLLMLHVLLYELDDEFFGLHNRHIEIQYKYILYYDILQYIFVL